MAKYKEVAAELKKRILHKEYPSGQRLPEQQKLAEEFNTSRVTIQKALQLLVVEGLILTRQGSGTYVRKNTLDISPFDSISDEYSGLTNRISDTSILSSKVILFEVRFPTEKECDKLLTGKTSPIYDIVRLRLLDNEPYLLEYTKMPVQLIPHLNEEILQDSIYAYVQEGLNLQIGGANRKIRAAQPEKLDKEYLLCTDYDPVLEVEQVVYLSNGIPFEYSKTRHRFDKGDILVLSTNNK